MAEIGRLTGGSIPRIQEATSSDAPSKNHHPETYAKIIINNQKLQRP
jgi:hypothetical protein